MFRIVFPANWSIIVNTFYVNDGIVGFVETIFIPARKAFLVTDVLVESVFSCAFVPRGMNTNISKQIKSQRTSLVDINEFCKLDDPV